MLHSEILIKAIHRWVVIFAISSNRKKLMAQTCTGYIYTICRRQTPCIFKVIQMSKIFSWWIVFYAGTGLARRPPERDDPGQWKGTILTFDSWHTPATTEILPIYSCCNLWCVWHSIGWYKVWAIFQDIAKSCTSFTAYQRIFEWMKV